MDDISCIVFLILVVALISVNTCIFSTELANADSFLSQIPSNIALTNAEDVTVDSSGNIYAIVNHNVKKFTSDGILLLEFGSFGSGDGQFSYPRGIALDSSGNIYVADTGNNRIQKFNSTGAYQFKFGSSGSSDGQFSNPRDMALDSSGNIYVADTDHNAIQKFNSTGAYQFKFGSFGSGDGQFNTPGGIALDSSGNIYVADTGNNRIQKFNSTGAYQFKFGSSGSSDGQFNTPGGIALDSSGNIYVADTGNNRIQKFNSTGAYQFKFGSSGSSDGQFSNPRDIALDSSGNIYVADTNNNRIQKFNSTGAYQFKFGSSGSSDGQFSNPRDIALDSSGNIYVADTNNNRIQKFNSTGAYQFKFGSSGSSDGQFSNPRDIALDSSGNIYVADSGNNRIQKFNSTGAYQFKFGSSGSSDGQFNTPGGIALDSSGNIYVADTGNNRIQKFNSTGVFQSESGIGGSANSQFANPEIVTLYSSNIIYVADTGNNRIQKFGVSAIIPPTFTAVRTGVDTIVLTFSENVDTTTTAGQGYTLSTGVVIANTDPAGSSNIITLTTSGITGTSATPTITYGSFAGTTVGLTGNEVVNNTNAIASDAVPPTFTAKRTSPTTWVLTFSENVDALTSENSAWIISGGNIVTAVTDPDNTKILIITTAASTGTLIGQTITYIASNGTVSDSAANEIKNGTNVIVTSYENTSSVSGTIFADVDGDGVQGVSESGIAGRTIILVDGNGTRLADQITDANGIYNFTGVAPGTLLVQTAPVPQNHLPSSGFASWARPTAFGGFTTIVNFPMTPITLQNSATVNGTVFEDTNNNGVQDGGEPGLAGVQVFVVDFLTLTQTTVLTDTNGAYSATGILPDVVLVQVSPIPAGHIPHTFTYSFPTLSQGTTTTVNFALKPITPSDQGTIAINVFNDANSNGLKDNGEVGVQGAIVFTFELLTAQADVQGTNSTGFTTHSGLIPDVVLAQINASILPPGFTTITTVNGGFEFIPVTSGNTTIVKIGLH